MVSMSFARRDKNWSPQFGGVRCGKQGEATAHTEGVKLQHFFLAQDGDGPVIFGRVEARNQTPL